MLTFQQKKAVLAAVKTAVQSTIDVNPFSSLVQPSNEEECDSQMLELVKVFEIPPAGVQEPTPGQSDVTWSK
jgi:hypothetical protein